MDKARQAERYLPAARAALEAFPVEPGKLEPVWISENVTFRVRDDASNRDWVLRLHRPGYHTREELNSERVWTRALDEVGVRTQAGLRTRTGEHFHPVEIAETGETRFAGMTEWIEGRLLNEIVGEKSDDRTITESYRQLGAIAATIHDQSSDWTPPDGFVRHSFDLDGLMGEAPFWGRFWEHPGLSPEQSELLLRTRARIRDVLQRYGSERSRFSLIHADLHSGNVLVRDGDVTVIDFDDAGFGWHMYELAVALFQEQASTRFAEMRQALLEGYRMRRPLEDRDVEMLPTFLLIRGLAILGWMHERPELDTAQFFSILRDAVAAQCEAFQAP